jgi:hypothetical protein
LGAGERNAVYRAAGIKAESIEGDAEAAAETRCWAMHISVCGGGFVAAVLAEEVLRFQCVESKEEDGEVGIHAHESGEAWVVPVAERLGVEFFLLVRGAGRWIEEN